MCRPMFSLKLLIIYHQLGLKVSQTLSFGSMLWLIVYFTEQIHHSDNRLEFRFMNPCTLNFIKAVSFFSRGLLTTKLRRLPPSLQGTCCLIRLYCKFRFSVLYTLEQQLRRYHKLELVCDIYQHFRSATVRHCSLSLCLVHILMAQRGRGIKF